MDVGRIIKQQITEVVQEEVARATKTIIEEMRSCRDEPQAGPEWMTAKAFCERFSMSRSTLQRFKEQNRVDVLHGGGRFVRYRWKEESLNVTRAGAGDVSGCGDAGGRRR